MTRDEKKFCLFDEVSNQNLLIVCLDIELSKEDWQSKTYNNKIKR